MKFNKKIYKKIFIALAVLVVSILIKCIGKNYKTFLYETFLIDEIKNILRTNPPCLLTDKIKKYYDENNQDYCSLLSEDICDKSDGICNDCEWSNNKCIKKYQPDPQPDPNPKPTPSPPSDCLDGCKFTNSRGEKQCYAKDRNDFDSCGSDAPWGDEKTCNSCPNCKWCISSDYDTSCVSSRTRNFCSKCPNSRECKHVNPPSNIPPNNNVCYMSLDRSLDNTTNSDRNMEYRKYGCNLYDAYQKCQECAKEQKCFGLIAGGGYGCVGCAGTPSFDCLANPLDGGAGCPGRHEPIDPAIHGFSVCPH